MHPEEWRRLDLPPGSLLGPYRIDRMLGEGGMGRVYRASDTRLGREVAIKVSAERFSNRFEREARAVAALNHPNISTLYDVGPNYLVMELVEGPTLAERLLDGAMPLDEAIRTARRIAEALEAAHAKGIVHRDLKPANIKIRSDGGVKVLDFGLALQAGAAAVEGSTATITAPGTIVGTAAYMSPEQARGKPVDQRTDVWAFGAVLYEMVTGQRAFRGETVTDILAAVVTSEPDWKRAPAPVRRLLQRCLEKDPERRLRHIADFWVLLDDRRPAIRTTRKVRWVEAAVVLAMVAASASLALLRRPGHPVEAGALRTVKFTITPANLVRGGEGEIDAEVSISRDGKHIAYVESQGGQLWIRDIDQENARPVPGAKPVYQAFWSPDNRWIGYSAGTLCPDRSGCDLVKIPVEGGTPTTIVKLSGLFRRACWSSDGETIVYCDTTGMYTVPAKGGPATRIVEHSHIEHPSFLDLPDGRQAFLFQAVDSPAGHGIYVQVKGESRRHLLTMSSSTNPYPVYSPTGHIVYVDGTNDAAAIWALPFSLKTLQPTGKAFRIAERGSSPVVSRTGTLVYSDPPSNQRQLAWVDHSGRAIGNIGQPEWQSAPTLSPDGKRLAVEVLDSGVWDLWIYDLARGMKSRLTNDKAIERLGAWTPAGDRIAYASSGSGNGDIFSKAASGDGEAALLVGTPADERLPVWSPDQRYLLYSTLSRETKMDLLYRERLPDGSLGPPAVFVKTPSNEGAAQFSPDGRFVAYVSDESGRNEMYVRDFPKGANRWQISASGGTAPRWRRDGREIFYVEGHSLMAVSVATRPVFSPGTPVRLFAKRSLGAVMPQYDVSADGKRFIVLDHPAGEPPLAIHVVNNWFEEFRARP